MNNDNRCTGAIAAAFGPNVSGPGCGCTCGDSGGASAPGALAPLLLLAAAAGALVGVLTK